MALDPQLITGISTGLASAGTVTFAFGLVLRVLGQRIDKVENGLKLKLDATECKLRNEQIVKALADGAKFHQEISKEMSAQGKQLANIEGKVEMIIKQTGGG